MEPRTSSSWFVALAFAGLASSASADPPKAPAVPVVVAPFSAVTRERAGSFFVVEGCVTDAYRCPPCPKGALCKPCDEPHVTLQQVAPSPSVDELTVYTGTWSETGAGKPGEKKKDTGAVRVRMTVKTAARGSSVPPRVELVDAATVGTCPEPPHAALIGSGEIVWMDPATRSIARSVTVSAAASRPVPGAYVLVGLEGPVARLVPSGARDRAGSCPFAAEFALDGPLVKNPKPGDPLAVVGPVADARVSPRLMRAGLAMTGRAGAEEPLGVPPPGGVPPTFAVDLDADGVADVALVARRKFGKVEDHFLVRHEATELWERHQKSWTRPSECHWDEKDLVGP